MNQEGFLARPRKAMARKGGFRLPRSPRLTHPCFWAKVDAVKKLLLLPIVGMLLTSCANPRPPVVDVNAWYPLTDPLTGRTFRCHENLSQSYGGWEVRAEWCYEVHP